MLGVASVAESSAMSADQTVGALGGRQRGAEHGGGGDLRHRPAHFPQRIQGDATCGDGP